MVGQMLLPRECLGAKRALMRRLPGVKMHVVGEVLLARKRLGAVSALERRLACMLSVPIHSD